MPKHFFNLPSRRNWHSWMAIVLLAACSCLKVNAQETDGTRFFRDRIEPVLKAQCYSCHSRQADELQGGLRLDFKAAVLRGGDSGPAIVAGKSGESLLIRAIRHEGDLVMPPKKPKLADKTIADFVKWVEMGAPDPRSRADRCGRFQARGGSEALGVSAAAETRAES